MTRNDRIDWMALDFCGLDPDDDLYCRSIQVEWVASDDALFGREPSMYCQALRDAEMLLDHASCSLPVSDTEGLPF